MSIYTFNNKVLKHNNKLLVGGEPGPLKYSGTLKLPQTTRFANGFNGIGGVWDSGTRKYCADVLNKHLSFSDNRVGGDGIFTILRFYRKDSDYVGEDNILVDFSGSYATYLYPSYLPNDRLRAYGDYSPIYMDWESNIDYNISRYITVRFEGGTEDMFYYKGGNEIYSYEKEISL